MRGVVLLGVDQEHIAMALEKHAPQVPVYRVADSSEHAMDEVVGIAADMAQDGDTVLLAPGCASWDMFRDYSARGEAFVSSVHKLGQ
jgi:UDP-N-acetylmuramoylalanine--D-glutamate ligase